MHWVDRSSPRHELIAAESELRARRILLFVTPPDSISEALFYAIEREFPWIDVEHVPDLQTACSPFEQPVPLILIDAGYLRAAERYAAELGRLHPSALIAVMHDNMAHPLSPEEVFASSVVRSVLPMSLKLDVWLSVIRLLLRGGEYFPAELFQRYLPRGRAAASPRVELGQFVVHRLQACEDELEYLTEREVQILEMVARGLQNKIIAADLRLSEHTVKIHMHNIITKLGAHNRTEAAAIFHSRAAVHSAGPAPKPAAAKP